MTVAAARTSDEARVRELLAGLDDELVALAEAAVNEGVPA